MPSHSSRNHKNLNTKQYYILKNMSENKKYDIYLWHINFPEDINLIEAYYIIFLIKVAERKLGRKLRKILDLACGIGRHHRYLREEGYEVWGIDINKNLIELAKERNKGYEKYYIVQDMREIEFKEEFDIVLNWFTSFAYFKHEENMKVLRNIYNALKSRGILILDFPLTIPHIREVVFHTENIVEITTNKLMDENTILHDATLYIKQADGSLKPVKKLKITIRAYTPKEIKQMLEETGFKILYILPYRMPIPIKILDPTQLALRGVRRLVWIAYKE